MKKLRALLAAGALLAGLLAAEAVPAHASGCGTMQLHSSASHDTTVYDQYIQGNTYVRIYFYEYYDGANCYQFQSGAIDGDTNPNVGFHIDMFVQENLCTLLPPSCTLTTVVFTSQTSTSYGASFASAALDITQAPSGHFISYFRGTDTQNSVFNWCGAGSSTYASYWYYAGMSPKCDTQDLGWVS